jgi:membrane protease YdiL (CAAX protease family)
VRLAVAALLVLITAYVLAGLAPTRPVLLAVASVAAPFTLWSATPSIVSRLGDHLSYQSAQLTADAAYLGATLAVAGVARLTLPAERRLSLRLGRPSWLAAAAAVVGVAVLLGLAMAIPADLLGRDALQPVALRRDLPLLGPAFLLQGATQELQFRGLLLAALELDLPPWAANLGQATLFGLAHIAVQYEGPAGPFVPVTIALGVLLGWLTQWTRSLWPAIVIHGVLEVAAIVIMPGLYGY